MEPGHGVQLSDVLCGAELHIRRGVLCLWPRSTVRLRKKIYCDRDKIYICMCVCFYIYMHLCVCLFVNICHLSSQLHVIIHSLSAQHIFIFATLHAHARSVTLYSFHSIANIKMCWADKLWMITWSWLDR